MVYFLINKEIKTTEKRYKAAAKSLETEYKQNKVKENLAKIKEHEKGVSAELDRLPGYNGFRGAAISIC